MLLVHLKYAIKLFSMFIQYSAFIVHFLDAFICPVYNAKFGEYIPLNEMTIWLCILADRLIILHENTVFSYNHISCAIIFKKCTVLVKTRFGSVSSSKITIINLNLAHDVIMVRRFLQLHKKREMYFR